MKAITIFSLLASIVFMSVRLYYKTIVIPNEYENSVTKNWVLADRSSTIEDKSKYIDLFDQDLQKANLMGTYANLFANNPTTEFYPNYLALVTLKNRLKEIQQMNPNSFEYQTALHQITEQEQGQASNMLQVFYDCWMRVNHYTYWSPLWVFFCVVVQVVLLAIGLYRPINYFLNY